MNASLARRLRYGLWAVVFAYLTGALLLPYRARLFLLDAGVWVFGIGCAIAGLLYLGAAVLPHPVKKPRRRDAPVPVVRREGQDG